MLSKARTVRACGPSPGSASVLKCVCPNAVWTLLGRRTRKRAHCDRENAPILEIREHLTIKQEQVFFRRVKKEGHRGGLNLGRGSRTSGGNDQWGGAGKRPPVLSWSPGEAVGVQSMFGGCAYSGLV